MAVLTDTDRADAQADFMRRGDAGTWQGLLKTDLRAALNAVDQWVSDNAASYNTALPVTFRTNATAAQKALLLLHVVSKRFLSGV